MKGFINNVFLLRLGFFLIGLLLFSLGIALTICANFGVSPWDATTVGLYERFGLSIGTWMNVQSVLLILMGATIKRERPRFECMITSFIMGIFVDIFVIVLQDVHVEVWYLQIALYALGVLIVSIGCGTYLIAKFPPCTIDYFMMAIKTGFHTNITVAMSVCEGTGFLFALLVQGPIGIGTFLCVVIYGPLIDTFHHYANRLYNHLEKQLPQVVHNAVDI